VQATSPEGFSLGLDFFIKFGKIQNHKKEVLFIEK